MKAGEFIKYTQNGTTSKQPAIICKHALNVMEEFMHYCDPGILLKGSLEDS